MFTTLDKLMSILKGEKEKAPSSPNDVTWEKVKEDTEYLKSVISEDYKCGFCGCDGENLQIVECYLSILGQREYDDGSVNLGQGELPTIALVCTKCGHINFFSKNIVRAKANTLADDSESVQ